jgi:hypothetical protein
MNMKVGRSVELKNIEEAKGDGWCFAFRSWHTGQLLHPLERISRHHVRHLVTARAAYSSQKLPLALSLSLSLFRFTSLLFLSNAKADSCDVYNLSAFCHGIPSRLQIRAWNNVTKYEVPNAVKMSGLVGWHQRFWETYCIQVNDWIGDIFLSKTLVRTYEFTQHQNLQEKHRCISIAVKIKDVT